MQQSDIMKSGDVNAALGFKAVVYGGPGTAKTPTTVETSERPVVLLSEPGFLSVKNPNIPTYPAFSPPRVDEFMAWFKGSHEAKNFDTLVWDSVSQSAEKYVETELAGTTKGGNEAHGMRAYGKMARWMYGHLSDLYFMQQKHIVLICKQQAFEVNGGVYYRPYFPGKELPVRVPHLFDVVARAGIWNVPGVGETRAFRIKEQFDQMGRDRSGNLAEYEPMHIGQMIKKFMQR